MGQLYVAELTTKWVTFMLLLTELHKSRNFGPALHKFGIYVGGAFNYIDQNLLGGKIPVTLKDDTPDHETLKSTEESATIEYPSPDGKISFDKPSSVFLSNTTTKKASQCT